MDQKNARAILENDVVSATDSQVSCDLDGETVILNVKDGVYYGLNDVGARIWELLREPRRVFEIRDILLAEFDAEPDMCTRDLTALLKDLRDQRLIEVRNETSA